MTRLQRRQTPLERQLEQEHRASVARQMAPPKGLAGLLAWFVEGFATEAPESIHKSGVWRDYARLDEDRQPEGGSLLGAPALADGFRRLLEGSPFATEPAELEGHKSRDGDEHYRTPMRAALARLAGRGGELEESPFMARTLYRTAIRGGDWNAACASMGIVEPVRQVYIETALVRLWRRYSVQPRARTLRREEPAA